MNNKIEPMPQTGRTGNGKSQPDYSEVMISEFKNQLTQKEIIVGLIVYVNKKLLSIIILLTSVVFVFSFISNNNVLLSLFFAICAIIITEVILLFTLKQQLSTKKIATYKLYTNRLVIIGSNGISHTYEYDRIKSIVAKDVIVLCFSRTSFAIIAKRHLDREQMKIFTSI